MKDNSQLQDNCQHPVYNDAPNLFKFKLYHIWCHKINCDTKMVITYFKQVQN